MGQIASATVFEPKAAIIISNKDELKIPLLLETIPTPKVMLNTEDVSQKPKRPSPDADCGSCGWGAPL